MFEYSQSKKTLPRPPTSKPIESRSKSYSDLSKNHLKNSSRENNDIKQNLTHMLAWGRNRYFQYPYNANSLNGIVQIACGQKHSIFLNNKYQAYVCGDNQHGQLGLGSSIQYVDVAMKILKDKSVINVFTGPYNTFLLTNKGELYGCGLNNKGQLGLGCQTDQKVPVLIQSMCSMINKQSKDTSSQNRISSGMSNILTERQISSQNIIKQQTPQKRSKFFDVNNISNQTSENVKTNLLENQYVSKIQCGPYHTLILTTKGRVFTSGLKINQIDQNDYQKQFHQLKFKIGIVQKIGCGLALNAILTNEGKCYIWGLLNQKIINEPIMLDIKYLIDINFKGENYYVLNSKGQVYQIIDYDTQKGFKNKKIQNLPNIKCIFSGDNFTIAMSQSRQLFGWGNNKYGQLLGPLKKENHLVNTPNNYLNPIMIKVPGQILKLVCGSYHILAISTRPFIQQAISKQREQLQRIKQENEQLKALLRKKEKKTVKTQTEPLQKFQNPNNLNARTFSNSLQIPFSELVLQKQISQGGYGIIYKGKWRQTVVAIKVFKIDNSESSVKDFLSQCHAMQALRHPNIVMFLGACTKPPHLCIVLEYCTKGTLWSILQSSVQLSWQDRRRFALDTAKGMNYLHSCQIPILHRDLKSLNLLLDQSYRVKLADFGWTKGLQNYMTGKIGTYQWMAPQVISGQKYTEKADVFSFGIILWQIASREPPYRNVSGVQVSIEVANNDLRPTIPKKTPQNLVKLIKRCWDRNPDNRPSFKQIIRELQIMKLI